MMSIREKLDKIAPSATLFPELTQAEKETNRILVQIANRICSCRKELKETQAQFAQRFGVSQPMVCQWENGEYNYTIEKLVEILDQLHLRMDVTFRSTEMEEVIPVTSQYDSKKQRGKVDPPAGKNLDATLEAA